MTTLTQSTFYAIGTKNDGCIVGSADKAKNLQFAEGKSMRKLLYISHYCARVVVPTGVVSIHSSEEMTVRREATQASDPWPAPDFWAAAGDLQSPISTR
jgi:hypothetical protein